MYLVVFYVGEYVCMCRCVGGCVGVYTKSKSSKLSPLRRKLLRNFLLRCARKKFLYHIYDIKSDKSEPNALLRTSQWEQLQLKVIQATGRSEFEDGLGLGDFVSGYSYHMSVRTKVGVLWASHKIFNSEVRLCWNDASTFSSISSSQLTFCCVSKISWHEQRHSGQIVGRISAHYIALLIVSWFKNQ
jgi:hypothetical protein